MEAARGCGGRLGGLEGEIEPREHQVLICLRWNSGRKSLWWDLQRGQRSQPLNRLQLKVAKCNQMCIWAQDSERLLCVCVCACVWQCGRGGQGTEEAIGISTVNHNAAYT